MFYPTFDLERDLNMGTNRKREKDRWEQSEQE